MATVHFLRRSAAMKHCRHCLKEVHESARRCPHCGGAYPAGCGYYIKGCVIFLAILIGLSFALSICGQMA